MASNFPGIVPDPQWGVPNFGLDGSGSSNADLGRATGGEGFTNMFTGNLDFQRQLELLNRQISYNTAAAQADRAFNAAEAQKARDWQDQQNRTQYLRAAEQFKQLGINPAVLAFGGSAGTAAAGATSGTTAHTNATTAGSWQRVGVGGLAAIANFLGATASVVNVASKIVPLLKKTAKIGFV